MPRLCGGWLKVKAAMLFNRFEQFTFLSDHNFVQLVKVLLAQLTFFNACRTCSNGGFSCVLVWPHFCISCASTGCTAQIYEPRADQAERLQFLPIEAYHSAANGEPSSFIKSVSRALEQHEEAEYGWFCRGVASQHVQEL
jgi:hypothetical protein